MSCDSKKNMIKVTIIWESAKKRLKEWRKDKINENMKQLGIMNWKENVFKIICEGVLYQLPRLLLNRKAKEENKLK